jgi:pimeloyl-ACP methyl ester carboxylesterase
MRVVRVVLKYILAPALALLVIAAISGLAYRAYRQHLVWQETHITTPNGVESLEKVTLGGVEQWILIRGLDRSNPVLLFLHGGPGGADIALARFTDKRLIKHFVMVHWDQRGAGKSYSSSIPSETMTLDQFVSDTRELAEILRQRFGVPRIYLVGHSWGSALGAITAARHPELFFAFVGVGQFVDDVETEEIAYQFTLDRATSEGNDEALRDLEEIGPPPYDGIGELLVQRKWLDAFGGVAHRKLGNDWLLGATSPDYSALDGWRVSRGQRFTIENMFDVFSQMNLFRLAPRIEVPVYFFLGRHDFNTPPEIVKRYYEKLDAPRGKQIIWFENSGHLSHREEPERYAEMLVRVRRETTG